VVRELRDYGCEVSVHDPIADPAEAEHEYGIELVPWESLPTDAGAIVAAVAHTDYLQRPLAAILGRLVEGGVFVDVKSAYDPVMIPEHGHRLWRL
jgi:UDP-N-acetyl-D-galactosamine dehydrogenase